MTDVQLDDTSDTCAPDERIDDKAGVVGRVDVWRLGGIEYRPSNDGPIKGNGLELSGMEQVSDVAA